uniref:Huntingtin-interacting protein K n=1 Tax=Rhizophora mucronata TaxID=61149 RepID=A0A2P2KG06_RHIMU
MHDPDNSPYHARQDLKPNKSFINSFSSEEDIEWQQMHHLCAHVRFSLPISCPTLIHLQLYRHQLR